MGGKGALGPQSKIGLNSNEVTIAEMLKERGYATAIYGKWHLGHRPEFLPLRHGFDDYFGLPYSNDMWPKHPTAGTNYPPLPLFRGERPGNGLLAEDLRQPLGDLLFPLVDLRRMHLMLRRDHMDGLDFLQRLQPHLGLQRRTTDSDRQKVL